MRHVRSEASKRVMGPTPLFPATSSAQLSSLPIPSGETSPTPVTATRRGEEARGMVCSVLRGVLLDVLDGVLHLLDLLRGLVRNLDVEGFLERHDQLDGVERICAEVVHERSFGGHLIRIDRKSTRL